MKESVKDYIKNQSLQQKFIETICFLIGISAVVVSIRMNLVGRSLWFDEAALAWSFSQRDFFHLTSEGLEMVQAAPVGWLYILKIFTLLFGNTDYVLRVPSILFYVGTLVLMYYVFRKVFPVYYPMAGVAFAASLPILLQYSNVFKPYISDCFVILLAVILYDRYQKGELSAIKTGIAFAVLLWFSNPLCFVAGGLIGVGGLFALIQKDFKKLKKQVIICIPLGISFVVYYFYWLRKIDDGMNGFWRDYKYLLPFSHGAIQRDWHLTDLLFWQFYRWEYPVLLLLAVGFLVALVKKKEMILGIYGAFALAVFASAIGFFPVNKRMWLFIYPLITLILFELLDDVIPREEDAAFRRLCIGLVFAGVILINGGIRYYSNPANVYWPGYEVKGELAYLRNRLRPEDRVYVCSNQKPIFAYYNGYNMNRIWDTGNDVMVGDHDLAEGINCTADFDFITQPGSCYIVMGDTWDEEKCYGLLFSTLEKEGTLEKVWDQYDTPLFYFKAFEQ